MIDEAIRVAVAEGVKPFASEVRALRALVERLVERGDQLEPLSAILGCSAGAAAMRISRDPDLAALGLRVGPRQLRFRRAEVLALFAERARSGGRRTCPVVGGEVAR